MADDGYDPRFDPAFQRGFEGANAFPPRQGQARAPQPVQQRVTPPPLADSRGASNQERPFGGEHGPSPDRAVERAVTEYVAQARAEAEESPLRLRGNPFLIALIVIALALIAAGVFIASRVDAWYEDVGPDTIGFGLLNALVYGAPIAVGLGIATLIGVMFAFAVRWRGRSDD